MTKPELNSVSVQLKSDQSFGLKLILSKNDFTKDIGFENMISSLVKAQEKKYTETPREEYLAQAAKAIEYVSKTIKEKNTPKLQLEILLTAICELYILELHRHIPSDENNGVKFFSEGRQQYDPLTYQERILANAKPINIPADPKLHITGKLKEKLLKGLPDEMIDLKLDKYDGVIDIRDKSATTIKGAGYYTYVDDLWILSSYYNPEKFKTKRENYERFVEKISASKLNYIIIECAFGNDPFELPPSKNILQIRAKDIMWQKERLLNHAIKSLPESCKKVAWVDCDILFDNPDWAIDTSIALDTYKVVQPFEFAVRLPKDVLHFEGIGDWYTGFGYIYKNYPNILTSGVFANHGHTGFAWAAQRNLLQRHGLYDVCIGGSGDHIMAHAFCGDWDTGCIKRIMGLNHAYYFHYLDWCQSIYAEVKGKVSYIPGTVLHLWHGDLENRKYTERERKLESLNYNPYQDLKISKNGAWEWNTEKAELKKFTLTYFSQRKEDG